MENPGHGVEEAGDGVLRDAAGEEGVRGQGSEGVVVDLGVGGGGAAFEEGGVGAVGEDGAAEEEEPDVDAVLRLENLDD